VQFYTVALVHYTFVYILNMMWVGCVAFCQRSCYYYVTTWLLQHYFAFWTGFSMCMHKIDLQLVTTDHCLIHVTHDRCVYCSVSFWCRLVSWLSRFLKLHRCLPHRQMSVMFVSMVDRQRDHRYVILKEVCWEFGLILS